MAGAKALSSAVKGSSSSYSSSSNSDSNSYGRSCSDFVTFSFDGPGADVNAKIQMSGASSIKIKGNGSSNISARSRSLGGCIEGKYHFNYSNNTSWFGPPDNKTYRGSFSVPFSATHCEVKITQGFSAKISTSCN